MTAEPQTEAEAIRRAVDALRDPVFIPALYIGPRAAFILRNGDLVTLVDGRPHLNGSPAEGYE